jgi:hypothetical protein
MGETDYDRCWLTQARRQGIETELNDRVGTGELMCLLGAFTLFCVFGSIVYFAQFPEELDFLFSSLADFGSPVREIFLTSLYCFGTVGGSYCILYGVREKRKHLRELSDWIQAGRPLPPEDEAWIRAELELHS